MNDIIGLRTGIIEKLLCRCVNKRKSINWACKNRCKEVVKVTELKSNVLGTCSMSETKRS